MFACVCGGWGGGVGGRMAQAFTCLVTVRRFFSVIGHINYLCISCNFVVDVLYMF